MSKRNISNRSLRTRFFGFIIPGYNDNFNISHLKARIESEEKNLLNRAKAVAKYERCAQLFKGQMKKQSLEMAKIESEAIPQIKLHITYLREQLAEEEEKAIIHGVRNAKKKCKIHTPGA